MTHTLHRGCCEARTDKRAAPHPRCACVGAQCMDICADIAADDDVELCTPRSTYCRTLQKFGLTTEWLPHGSACDQAHLFPVTSCPRFAENCLLISLVAHYTHCISHDSPFLHAKAERRAAHFLSLVAQHPRAFLSADPESRGSRWRLTRTQDTARGGVPTPQTIILSPKPGSPWRCSARNKRHSVRCYRRGHTRWCHAWGNRDSPSPSHHILAGDHVLRVRSHILEGSLIWLR